MQWEVRNNVKAPKQELTPTPPYPPLPWGKAACFY